MKSRRKKGTAPAEQWDRLLAVTSSRLEVNKMPPVLPSGAPKRGLARQEPSQTDLGIAQILASIASSVTRSAQPADDPSPPETNGTLGMSAVTQQQQTPDRDSGSHTALNKRHPFYQNGLMKQEERQRPSSLAMGNVPPSVPGSKSQPALQSLSNGHANIPSPPLPNGYLSHPPLPRCCPSEIPEILLQILDHESTPLLEHLQHFFPYQRKMCHDHLQKFVQTSLNFLLEKEAARTLPSLTYSSTIPAASATTSVGPVNGGLSTAEDGEPRTKRRRVDGSGCDSSYYDCVVTGKPQTHAPALDHGPVLHNPQESLRSPVLDHGQVLHNPQLFVHAPTLDSGTARYQPQEPARPLVLDHGATLSQPQELAQRPVLDQVPARNNPQKLEHVPALDHGPVHHHHHQAIMHPRLANHGPAFDPQENAHPPVLDHGPVIPHPQQFAYPPNPDYVPNLDTARDEAFRRQVMQELQARPGLEKGKTHGDVTSRLILKLLEVCKSPDDGEALLLSGPEAAARMESGVTDCPVFTDGQQQFSWAVGSRPIVEMFRRMENLNRNVSVQVPSRKYHLRSFEKHKLLEVQQRFLESGGADTDDPWNILDLRNPLPPTVMPKFLAAENCQLLSRVRDAVLSGSSGERTVAAKEKWNEWLDVMDWVLLSEGGHNTAPHMDSHGLSTWITIQEGLFGFGWLSKPTKEERDAWVANPQEFTGGRWRFTVLTPGKTVFFNSGTIHFVFRLRRGQTLALGGHILQWSGIERWITVVRDQMRSPQITNEDVEWSAPKYVRVVADLVANRVKTGRVDEIGGQEVVDRFLALVQEFEQDIKNIKKEAKKEAKPASKKKR